LRFLFSGALAASLFFSPLSVVRADEPAPIAVRFETSYAGSHPAEFADLLSQVQAIVPAAMAYITGQWGLPNTLYHPLIVTISDVSLKTPGRQVSAYVRANGEGDGLRQRLVVDLEHHMLYPNDDLESVLYHEMAHAILRDAVTAQGSRGIPTWFNEGLAQSITTEGRLRTEEDFKRWGHSDARAVLCDLNGKVDEFLHGEYNFGCYTQFYLAVRQLLARGGKDTIPRLISGLHDGYALPEVIARITGLDWPAFQQDVMQYTLDVFAGNQPIP
jgi:hypothetical protein